MENTASAIASQTQGLVQKIDQESEHSFQKMTEMDRLRGNRIPGVRTVLFVLSSRGMVFDTESLRQKVLLAYPEATVFFMTTMGKPVGATSPRQVDLLIDFTGPRQRQGWFFARKLRSMARVAVGRNAGLFRKGLYDRIFDEKQPSASLPGGLPTELLERERFVQKQVLSLVGITIVQAGDTPKDRSKSIALELPPMQRL
jgi:hypothetical protein